MKTNSTVNARGIPGDGPSIVGPHLWSAIGGNPGRLLSAEERAQLAIISSIARYRKGERLYAEGERAEAVFNIVTGVVETHTEPDGIRHILAFLFPEDLVGLAQNGTYMNSAEAVTNSRMSRRIGYP